MADQNGLSVFLANSNAEPEREVRVARKFEERRVDGIIVTASRVGAQYVPLFTHMQVPIVLLNNQHPSQSAHSVMIANTQASLDAVRHLIALGHRRFAYLGDRYGRDPIQASFWVTGGTARPDAMKPVLVAHGDGKPEGAKSRLQGCCLGTATLAIFFNDMSALGGYAVAITATDTGRHFRGGFRRSVHQPVSGSTADHRKAAMRQWAAGDGSLLQIPAESGHDLGVHIS
jgi:DNA-binding LacI/PurR family transcriptional regulator